MGLSLGVLVSLEEGVEDGLEKVERLGFSNCQIACWSPETYSERRAEKLRKEAEERGIEITTLWAGWPGPATWDFQEGPLTLGLIPSAYRDRRVEAIKRGSDFAFRAGISSVTTHVGYLPENPNDQLYGELLVALKDLVGYCGKRDETFCFETGQETPVTLLRTIEDIGLDNLGINLDPANLLMYGKANPVDALSVFGQYVEGVHAKDGEYPTDGYELGVEKPLGEGSVDFPRLIEKLRGCGYQGSLTIEREISGPRQMEDIRAAKRTLESLL